MSQVARFFLTPVLLIAIAACGGPVMKEEPSEEFAEEGLHSVRASGFEKAYARPNAKLASYRSVKIEPLETSNIAIASTAVSGTTRRDWQMTPEREANLRNSWADAMNRAFADYEAATNTDKVLRITAEVTGLIPGRTSATGTTAGGMPVAGSGDTVDIAVEFRLYDLASDDLLAVIRDRRTIAGLLQRSGSGRVGIVNSFNVWAGLLHTRVSGR
jgi:hypothetical protein